VTATVSSQPSIVEWVRRHQTAMSVVVLALLAYIPSLTASPGRMPTDSKLYVYLDPGRFLADTTTTMDPRQFAGWVPHQHIAYLWPTGPWFWVFETLGVPDWIAHRLWIATLLCLAGLGVRWMARVLSFNPLAALIAALVYQLSPYILPYISRTSVLLLPYAGLGWIVGLTVLAGREGRWRYPAAIALVVLTVGAVNATALAMVIPAPVIWLVHAAWQRSITWRRAMSTALRTGLLCVGVSVWWMMMLVIQGRYGADVLAYSESLESVSFTSTSTEVTRGLGYWLFYVSDASSSATTASLDHLVSGRTILLGVVLIAAGLAGIVCFASEHRRFAALLFGAGVILGVGVHPIDDPSPLMSALVGNGEGGLALALRSSTRAVPVMLLGLGIGTAVLVSSIGDLALWRRFPSRRAVSGVAPRLVTAGLIATSAVVGLPALRTGGFVDPVLERDQFPPAYWLDAAAALDARPDGYRVLQVPGAEFGAFQWGYTVDQPLPGLTERPMVTRDLLPLGSPAAMDLAFALDDRIQSDAIEPESVAAVSRFLGVDTVWIAGDVSFDRFQLARPEVVTDALTAQGAVSAGLVDATAFGEPVVMTPRVPMIDDRTLSDQRIGEPIAPITLVDVADPIPTVRVKDDFVVLSGSGDGLVDAAAGGVLDGAEAVVYSATLNREQFDERILDGGYRFVLSDSNRDRAHHWRSSQDVTGFTESVAEESDVLRFEGADQRLPVFGAVERAEVDSDTQTVSRQIGPVRARASSYGERFAYLPEHRPVMAIDGDPTTSWLVADRAPAVGEFIELSIDSSIDHLDLLQPTATELQRTITEVRIDVAGGESMLVALDESSRVAPGQRVAIPPTAGPAVATITITATTNPQPAIGDAIGSVGFVEIDVGLGPTVETIRTPIDGLDEMASAESVDIVLTRLRAEPTDRWRSDPEPSLDREFEVAEDLAVDMSATLRLDRRLDDVALAELLGEPVVATSHLAGAPSTRGAAAFDADESTAWTTPFDRAVGEAVVFTSGPRMVSQLIVAQPGGDNYSPITMLRVTDSAGSLDVDVSPDGEADVALSRPIDLADVRIEILAIDERFTQDRRFNEPVQLPAAITEITFDGVSPGVHPVEQLSGDCLDSVLTIDRLAVPLRFEVRTSEALSGKPIAATPCSWSDRLDAGTHRLVTTGSSPFDVDRVVLSSIAPDGAAQEVSTVDPQQQVIVNSSSRHATLDVPPCPNGCWVIYGEGYNNGWAAQVDGKDLGPPTLLDGNANGWWIEPSDSPTRVEIDWPVQRGLNIAFAASGLAVLACLALILRGRKLHLVSGTEWNSQDPEAFGAGSEERVLVPRGSADTSLRSQSSADPPHAADGRARRSARRPGTEVRGWAWSAVATAGGAALFIDWVWVVPVLAVWAVAMLIRRPRVVGLVGLAMVVGAQLVVTSVVRSERPFPNAGWPVRFEWLHSWTLLGVVLVTGSGLISLAQRDTPVGDM
jgi:arabinofuranan 3-O-arabinosyltransferase